MKKLLFVILAAAVFISGCNKADLASKGGPGILSVTITDDPFDVSTVESATITISKIEIRKAGESGEEAFLDLPMTPIDVNVFELRNGLKEELVSLEVPQGDYDLVRVYVDEANLKLKDVDEPFNMKVPSGPQTGIKVFISPVIHVEGGLSAELLLDFDLSRSFVMRGHNAQNGFIFKPVIRAANISTTGRIEGTVTDNSAEKVAIENATVTLIKDGVDPVTAMTDATGHYVFIGVDPGTYSMTAEKENFVKESVESVVVHIANKTEQDFVLKGLPVYVSSVIENAAPTVLEITFSLPLATATVPDASAFSVTVATVARAVSSITITDKKVKLTLASAVAKGEVVTVAYTKPATNPLQTPDGLQVESFPAKTATNNIL